MRPGRVQDNSNESEKYSRLFLLTYSCCTRSRLESQIGREVDEEARRIKGGARLLLSLSLSSFSPFFVSLPRLPLLQHLVSHLQLPPLLPSGPQQPACRQASFRRELTLFSLSLSLYSAVRFLSSNPPAHQHYSTVMLSFQPFTFTLSLLCSLVASSLAAKHQVSDGEL
jgi:hypothetical protein